MIRRPPRSTLFPTRRSSDLCPSLRVALSRKFLHPEHRPGLPAYAVTGGCAGSRESSPSLGRSEEHTSELQSRRDLVCRLLLEKKKKNNKTTIPHNTLSALTI